MRLLGSDAALVGRHLQTRHELLRVPGRTFTFTQMRLHIRSDPRQVARVDHANFNSPFGHSTHQKGVRGQMKQTLATQAVIQDPAQKHCSACFRNQQSTCHGVPYINSNGPRWQRRTEDLIVATAYEHYQACRAKC